MNSSIYRRFTQFLSVTLCASLLLLSPGPQAAQATANVLRNNGSQGAQAKTLAAPSLLTPAAQPSLAQPAALATDIPTTSALPTPAAAPQAAPQEITSVPAAVSAPADRPIAQARRHPMKSAAASSARAELPLGQGLRESVRQLDQTAPAEQPSLLQRMFFGAARRSDALSVPDISLVPHGQRKSPLPIAASLLAASLSLVPSPVLAESIHSSSFLGSLKEAFTLHPLIFVGAAGASAFAAVISYGRGYSRRVSASGIGQTFRENWRWLLPSFLVLGALAMVGSPLALATPLSAAAHITAGGALGLTAAFLLRGRVRKILDWYDSTGAPSTTLINRSLTFSKGKNKVSIKSFPFKRIFSLLAPYKKLLWLATGLMLLSGFIQIALPPIFRDLTSSLSQEQKAGWLLRLLAVHALPAGWASFLNAHFESATLWLDGGILAALLVAQYTLSRKISWLMTYIGSIQMKGLGILLLEHVMRLRMDYFQRKRAGEIVGVFDLNLYNFRFGATDMFTSTVQQAVILVIGAYFMFMINPLLAVVSLCLYGLGLGAIAGAFRNARNLVYVGFNEVKRVLTGFLSETFSGISLIKISANEARQVVHYEELSQETYMHHGMKIAEVTSNQGAMESTFAWLVNMIVGILTTILMVRHHISVSDFLTLNLLSTFVQRSVQTLTNNWSKLGDSQASFAGIADLLDTPAENYNADQPPLPPLQGEIKIRNVSFAYPAVPDKLVLKNVSFEIPAGGKIALVGFSGSGKSTLAALINKLNSPTGATITVKEKDETMKDVPARKLPALLDKIKENGRKVLEIADVPVNVHIKGEKKPLSVSAKELPRLLPKLIKEGRILRKISGPRLSLKIQGKSSDWAVPVSETDSFLKEIDSQGLELVKRVDYPQGQILVDGHDLETVNLADYRKQVGYVLQAPVLFAGTVESNLNFAKPDATLEEIERAAKEANAYNFIKDDLGRGSFEAGLKTVVGERGVRLSGGQAQRLTIARAFLTDPRILVLDEPTANLDASSEKLVMEALYRLMKGRTTIIIAHRLSTIQKADKIYLLDSGEIKEQGTFSELDVPGTQFRDFADEQRLQEKRQSKK